MQGDGFVHEIGTLACEALLELWQTAVQGGQGERPTLDDNQLGRRAR